MINNKRVKAHTIMEVTIVMLVTAILIGITYTSYSIISKSYLAFKIKNEDLANLSRLDQLLKRDFENAKIITGSKNMIRVHKVNGGDVEYHFSPDYMIRNSLIIDTFKISTDHHQLLYEKNVISEEVSDSDNTESNRIDELSFDVNYKNEILPYHYYKIYSSENLIKRNAHAIN